MLLDLGRVYTLQGLHGLPLSIHVLQQGEVMLVDGEGARDKVAVLVEDQPGFPSTEGRRLGEIVDLEVGLIDTGMKCIFGCQDCTGLPLKQCIDAGHVQQVGIPMHRL